MLFKANCERCGAPLIKGQICNYRDKKLCEDCYVLLYLYGRKAPDAFSPKVLKLGRSIPTSVERPLSTKR